MSPPMRGRGLKPDESVRDFALSRLAPHAGAWIETTNFDTAFYPFSKSPPMRGRGLKHKLAIQLYDEGKVAPHAGAWIETTLEANEHLGATCRPPCGGVD